MPQKVQCPQCKTAVGVRENAGGSRAECPHCGETFIVPGQGGAEGYPASGPADSLGWSLSPTGDSGGDDDDWLNLIDAPAAPLSSPNSASPPVPPAAAPLPADSGAPPSKSPESKSPPEKSPASSTGEGDGFDLDSVPLQPAKPRPSSGDPFFPDFPAEPGPPENDLAADFDERPADVNSDGQKIQYQKNYRVRCPTCGTQNDVTAARAGKKIRCRDCFTMIRVPQPPRVPRKAEIDMEAAPAFQFTPTTHSTGDRPNDPFRKSANELLAAASKVEKDEPKPDLDVPKIRDWAAAVFGIFLQIGVMAHWLILSTLASTVAFIALMLDSPVLVMGLFAAGFFFAAIVLACGFTIMQSVANDEEAVEDWPITLEPSEWFAATVFCFAAAGLAYGPGWFVGYMSFGTSLTTVCLSMISVFLIFPFVLLSMLDMQNIFVPFSPDVGRSVTRCEEAWGGFYFSSAIIFFFTFLIFVFASGLAPPAAAVLGIFTAVATTFVYFAMLGRLAFAIGESVNAEAKRNDIQEQREREREKEK